MKLTNNDNKVVNQLFLFDKKIREEFSAELLCGVDEAGRGCIAGPLVAAAVVFSAQVYIPYLNESKSLSPKNRELLFNQIVNLAEEISYVIIPTKIINTVMLSIANRLAIKNAVNKLTKKVDLVLVDGYSVDGIKFLCKNIIGGDKKSAVIASASIIAKVIRDKIMTLYDQLIPYYNFAKHKGYATKLHMKKIYEIGLCELHRYYASKFVFNKPC